MKGLKGIILGVLLAASVLMPFNVYAGTVTGDSPIIGVNVYVIDYEYGRIPVQGTVTLETDMTRWQCVSGSSSRCAVWQSQDTSDNVQNDITGTITYSNGSYSAYLYEFDFVFDDDYVGYVRFSSQITAGSGNIYYVNGSHLTITSTTLINSFTITEYQLTKKTDNIMWMFPIESFNLIYSMIENNIEMAEFYQYANYTFPFFNLKTNDLIGTFYWYQDVPNRFIYFCKNYTITETTFPQYFSVPNNVSFHDSGVINYVRIGSITYYLAWVETIQTTSASIRGNLTYVNSETLHFMPIFFGRMDRSYISTDFALNFGLSNRLLDNLDIIANGTVSSDQSASDLESDNDQMADDMNDLATIENGYNQDFNDQLENIDFSNPIQSNQGILPAANFVISVFNGLISNNPFSLLIIVCCILLIGKKVIGK